MGKQQDWVRGVLVAALLMLGFAIKAVLTQPPEVPSQTAPGDFATGRALARLQRILGDQRAHPVDSPAGDAVRGRLIAELRAMGLQPEVHEAMDCSGFPKFRVVSCSHVRNVVATVPGRTAGRSLLLDAHYDSTPTGPGAGDDGLGVATLLEIGSILKTSPALRPVTLLFNEGEEFGLNGSAAFVRTDPAARQIDSLVNIDTRGVSGQALMYETSQPNGAALALYGRAARRPYANSLSTDFAKLIPNTTDVVKFRPAGWTLMNFGIIGNETRYHSSGDTVAALDHATLYHLGSEALGLTRVIADTANPSSAGSGQVVFTDIAGRAFVQLPLPVAGVLLALLLIAAIVLDWRAKAVGKPLLVVAGVTVSGIAASAFVAFVATLARAGDFWRAYPLVSYLAVYAVLVAAMIAAWDRWKGRFDRATMRAAAWLFILLVGAIIGLLMPGGTIFFLVAPALALAGVLIGRSNPRAGTALGIAAAFIQFAMFAELLAGVETLLIDGPLWAVAPIAALAVVPALIELGDVRLRPAMGLMLVVAVCAWTAAMILPRSSAERPAAFGIDYYRDADQAKAYWGIADKEAPLPRSYQGQWRQDVLPYNARTRWIASAPLIVTPVATARLVASKEAGAGRRILVQLSPGGGGAVALRFAKDTRLLAAGLPGALQPIPASGQPEKAIVRCTGRSCEGLIIEALLADRRPVEGELFSTRFTLPPEGSALVAARPKNAIPQYAPDSTFTMTHVKL